jgi:acyl carrier protein
MSSNSNIETIQNWLVNQLADQLSLDPTTISVTEPLTRYGLDSIDAVTMVGDLEDWLDEELPSTLFWDHPTIAKSAQFLDENYEISLDDKEIATPVVEAKKAEPAAAGKGWGLFGKK